MKKTASTSVLSTIDLFPDRSFQQIFDHTYQLTAEESKKSIKNVLKSYISERMLPLLFERAGLNPDITHDHIPKQAWQRFAELVKAFPVLIHSTLSIEEAFVTGGGVNLKEIDPKTMESKLMEGLYFCGEVMDIHGYTGGYNITAAFTTGHCAGTNAAQRAASRG